MIRIEINRELCKGCELCVTVCPRKVLGLSTEFNAKGNVFARAESPENCVGCRSCAIMCPDAAIELYSE